MLKAYRPQQDFLSILALGDKQAVAQRNGYSLSGGWVWRWKNRIDQKFMGRFQNLPAMSQQQSATDSTSLTEELMRCGGCGAKLPADMLRRVLADLDVGEGSELGSDDAAVFSLSGDPVLVQSLDVLRELVSDPYVMGRIAANHALSDIYAMGAQPRAAQAFVSIPYSHERIQERDLRQLLAGALFELKQVNCDLVGGHSLEGSELSLGFSVTGIQNEQPLLHKLGAREGDHLILCKPLGTGVLYAAQRQGLSDGRWLAEAQASMLLSNAKAAEIAQQFSASACTDITGFGLLGHLHEMLKGSSLGAQIELSALPLLPGVEACIEKGLESTMYAANSRFESLIDNRQSFSGQARYAALFDPQTSGGLLLAVSPKNSSACTETLSCAGYIQTAVIGKVKTGSILLN